MKRVSGIWGRQHRYPIDHENTYESDLRTVSPGRGKRTITLS